MDKKTHYDLIKENRLEVLEKIIEKIDKDPLEYSKMWDSSIIAPFNPVTKKYYTGGNVLKSSIACQELDSKDPRFLTFLQIKEQGLSLNKGAKSIKMEYWDHPKDILTDEKIQNLDEKELKRIENKIAFKIKNGWEFKDENGNEIDLPIDRNNKYFNTIAKRVENNATINYFNVFNAKDIKGLPEFKYPKIEESELWEIADDFIASCPIKVKEVAQPKAFYKNNNTLSEIILPPRETFNSSKDFLSTLLHEMGHQTGEKFEREQSGKFGSLKYAREELVAEFTSIMVQSRLGIELNENDKNNHTAYLQNWIKEIKDKTKDEKYKASGELYKALTEASKSTDLIINRFKEKRKELGKEYVDILELNNKIEKSNENKKSKEELENPWEKKNEGKELER